MTTSHPVAASTLIGQLQWRYATKHFAPAMDIPPEQWQVLEQALVLSASSYGLQPYRFIVIRNPSLRQELTPAAFGQPQMREAPVLVVFAAATDVTLEDIDHFIARVATVRGVTTASLAAYRTSMVDDLVNGPRHSAVGEWAKRQAYLALGNLLSAAAMLGIDACPMEGFDPAAVDRILGLSARHLASTALCTLGYRSPDDAYARLAKVRMPASELIDHR